MDQTPWYRTRNIHVGMLTLIFLFFAGMFMGTRIAISNAFFGIVAVAYVLYLLWTCWHLRNITKA